MLMAWTPYFPMLGEHASNVAGSRGCMLLAIAFCISQRLPSRGAASFRRDVEREEAKWYLQTKGSPHAYCRAGYGIMLGLLGLLGDLHEHGSHSILIAARLRRGPGRLLRPRLSVHGVCFSSRASASHRHSSTAANALSRSGQRCVNPTGGQASSLITVCLS